MNTEIVPDLNLTFPFSHQSFVLRRQVYDKYAFHFGYKCAKLSYGILINNVYFFKYALTDEVSHALLL